MALVRCPTHGIPYNDENPRGCPACVQDTTGRKSQAAMMRELAEASLPVDDNLEAALRGPTLRERLGDLLDDLPDGSKWLSRGGPFVIVGLIITLIVLSGPTFVEQPDPPVFGGTPRPLEVFISNPITQVFAALGEQAPQPHPTTAGVLLYRYGNNLIITVINGFVYSIDLGLANRSWNGLRVGMTLTEAEGQMAKLGVPRPGGEAPAPPQIRDGRQVYASPESRPIRTLTSEVRARGSSCYDVQVELRPKQTGLLIDGDERFSVVGDENARLDYVVTKILAIDRSRRGPDGDAVC